MNDVGGMNGSSASANGGANSDSSSSGSDSKLCRDFIRNVCNRGKNCKFIHPENIKIRTEPIFCHDFQQGRCRRATCKFIHCSREIEEHYKKTGELPDNVYEGCEAVNGVAEGRQSRRSLDGNVRSNNKLANRANGSGLDSSSEIPVCKDFLKGVCNRPQGSCKYRHVNSQNEFSRSRGGRSVNGNGQAAGMRRRGSDGLYDSGPDSKKLRTNDSSNYDFRGDEFNEDFYVGNNAGRGYTALSHPLPPQNESRSHSIQNAGHPHGPPVSAPDNHGFLQFHQNPATSTFAIAGSNRNGYNSGGAGDSSVAAYLQVSAAETIKALEDENFMLKRRIEELKTSNEFLLGQNAQLRLNSSLSVSRTSVGVENVQVQPTVGVTSGVVQTMVSMAQPMGMTPSLSVAATQPLSTISTLSTVSMPPVSISQALPVVSIAQHQAQPQPVYPMVTTQGVLPQPPNLS